MKTGATTVKEYLAALPDDRRGAISAVRDLVNRELPDGFRETVGYGMIVWSVPLEVCPDTYNGQPLMYAALASQKQYMAIYLMTVYGDSKTGTAFRDAFKKAGKKLDMGKSCVRFRKLEELHLPAIALAIAACDMKEYVRRAQAARNPATRKAAQKQAGMKARKASAPARKTKVARPARRKPSR